MRQHPGAHAAGLAVFLFFLFPFSLARGALDPETNKPYQLQVVLHIAENRVLTPAFRYRLQQELHDSLQAALGDLAVVEIVSDHPLLKAVEARGLQAALDGYTDLSHKKTHFVLVDFVNGRYEIQARQHDGFTGLSSPVVRHDSPTDRKRVARSAALLIDQDFGLAGTVEVGRMEGERVDITLKGGVLGVPLDHWVQKDQVFAVAQIYQEGNRSRSLRMPGTLLKVLELPRAGICHCQVLHSKENPLPLAATVLGYRCLKLGTTREQVRLRVVDDSKLHNPRNAMGVRFSADGSARDTSDRTSTGPDGLAKSWRAYENVVFASIYQGESLLARVPVEIVDGLTVTYPVFTNSAAEAKGELYARRSRWLKHLYDTSLVANTLVQQLNAMAEAPSEQRVARAEEGRTMLKTDMSNLRAECASLRADAANQLPKNAPLILKEDGESLQALQERSDELDTYIAQLREIVQKEKDPRRQQWKELWARANLLESDDEFEKAIALYERLLRELEQAGEKDKELRPKLDTLKRNLGQSSEAHKKAQAFIYEVWPKQETAAQIESHLSEAYKAFRACKECGDILSPRKLLKTFGEHAARLAKEADGLRPEAREDDRRTAETILRLTPELQKFNDDVKEYLKKAKPAGK